MTSSAKHFFDDMREDMDRKRGAYAKRRFVAKRAEAEWHANGLETILPLESFIEWFEMNELTTAGIIKHLRAIGEDDAANRMGALHGACKNYERCSKKKRQQDSLMKFDPSTGDPHPYPSHAQQWREWHGDKAWLFNPWTGERRDASVVGSDTFGLLIIPPWPELKP